MIIDWDGGRTRDDTALEIHHTRILPSLVMALAALKILFIKYFTEARKENIWLHHPVYVDKLRKIISSLMMMPKRNH